MELKFIIQKIIPSITERMKNLKPRYDREERNIYKGYKTAFN